MVQKKRKKQKGERGRLTGKRKEITPPLLPEIAGSDKVAPEVSVLNN